MQQQSKIIFLTDKNFGIGKGTKGNLLFNDLKGISIVLMYSTNCSVCHQLIPIFKELPNYVPDCTFAVINLDNNKDVIAKSQLTTMEIKYVPQLICFHNGKPFIKYTGEKSLTPMVNFFKETISRVQQSLNFAKQPERKQEDDNDFSGIPYNVVCDEETGTCYLTDSELTNGKEDCSSGECCYLSDAEL